METSISPVVGNDVPRDFVRDNSKTNLDAADQIKSSPTSEAAETAKIAVEKSEELKEMSREVVEDITESVNSVLETLDRDIRFVVDGKDGEFFTSIVDRNTKELIREIPNQEVRDLAEKLQNYNDAINEVSGLFVDTLI